MSSRVLIDTNILISFYNRGLYEEPLAKILQTTSFLVSAVTLNEFIRGAHDKVSKEIAKSFFTLMKGQIVTPTEQHWTECAWISERLLKKKRPTKLEVMLLQNDILIALSARDVPARLITADKKDFKIISELVGVEIEFW